MLAKCGESTTQTIPAADNLYDEHLQARADEGLNDDPERTPHSD